MKINIERGRLRQWTRSVRALLLRISFVAARRLPRLPWRQTSNSIRHNQLSQSSKCKTNTSLQTFNKGRNTGWWFIERCKMNRTFSSPTILLNPRVGPFWFWRNSLPRDCLLLKHCWYFKNTTTPKRSRDIKTGCLPINKTLFLQL